MPAPSRRFGAALAALPLALALGLTACGGSGDSDSQSSSGETDSIEVEDNFGTETVALPMQPSRRSLNLANAVSVAVYEAWRQHGFAGAASETDSLD